jgi:hypothetical protein
MIISFIAISSLMCTGSFMVMSHVDTVGLQAHPSWQPWTNATENSLGKPSGGIS